MLQQVCWALATLGSRLIQHTRSREAGNLVIEKSLAANSSATGSEAARDESGSGSWQKRKSAQTRKRVLQATIDCIYELGYSLTTTDKVAARAKVSRGAMLHHFPNRRELITAAVRYLNEQRLQNFLTEEQRIQTGGEPSKIGAGIDVYWSQLSSPLFVVFQELRVLSRTDQELREALEAALADSDTAWRATVERVFPDLTRSARHELANSVTIFLCEGMALQRAQRLTPDGGAASQTPQTTEQEAMALEALKTFLRTSYSDVRPIEAGAQQKYSPKTQNRSENSQR